MNLFAFPFLRVSILLMFTLLFGCLNPLGDGGISLNSKDNTASVIHAALSSTPEAEYESGSLDLNLSFSLDKPLTKATSFSLRAYSNSSCENSASGTLLAADQTVDSNTSSITFSNFSYTLFNSDSEHIYLKLQTEDTAIKSACLSSIKIKIKPVVLGQPDFTSSASQSLVSATSFGPYEYKLHSDGNKLVVSDYMNSRVLIWNSIPNSILQVPDVVLGQPDFTSNTPNNGGLSAASLSYSGGVAIRNNKLFVTDYGNHRVLIWNSIPTANKQAADIVLGQPDMISNTGNNGGISAGTLNWPWHLFVTDNRLFVSDYGNHRILIWNSLSLSNGQTADVVIGQLNMTSNTSNRGLPAANSQGIKWPYEVTSDGTRVAIADSGNNRVLIWNSIPSSNGVAADVVVGQDSFTGDLPNKGTGLISASSIDFPSSVYFYNDGLFVSDANNYRILRYEPVPTSNGSSATALYGQTDFVTSSTVTASKSSIKYVEGLYVDAHRMILGDAGNNRVLIVPPF